MALNPGFSAAQVASRKAYKATNLTKRAQYRADRNTIIAATRTQGGAAGAQARRTQLKALYNTTKGTSLARQKAFKTDIRANRPLNNVNFGRAPTPGSFTFAGGAPNRPPTTVDKNRMKTTQILLRKAYGTGTRAPK